jgi:hypothetical protein
MLVVRFERSLRRMRCTASFLVLAATAACSKGNSNPIPTLSPVPGSLTEATTGVAYIPDGGNGSTKGLQVVHFEDINGNLLPAPGAPAVVSFPGSVGPLAFASDGSTALSVDSAASGAPFTQVQDIFGVATVSVTPIGGTYNITQTPTAAPSAAPTAAPLVSPTFSDITGAAIVGTGFTSVGLLLGNGGSGILGVSSLTNAPPQYAKIVPFTSSEYTVNPSAAPSPGTRNNIVVSTDSTETLVRGADLMAFTVSSVATGYQFNATAYAATLGTHPNILRGHGGMAIDPVANGTALLLQAPGANDVTLVNGLPGALNSLVTVTLPSHPHAVAWAPNGASAVVGADGGYYVFSGMGSNALTLAAGTPTSPIFVGCDGKRTDQLSSVYSIAISLDSQYLVLFGPSSASGCAAVNGALVVLPFVPPGTTATPTPVPSPASTPAPSMFVQNGLITPVTDQDYMVVR